VAATEELGNRVAEGCYVADIHFLRYALSDYDVSIYCFASSQAKLNQKNAQKITFAHPLLPEQRRIVAHLDALQAKADSLRALQSETAPELDAILPSVLNRAFVGGVVTLFVLTPL